MRTHVAVALLSACAACAPPSRPATLLPPLGNQGELHVYALPLAREAERLSFTLEAISLYRDDGTEVPLELAHRELGGAGAPVQRLLASGRIPPGEYAGLSIKAAGATLDREGERSRLLVESAPERTEVRFRVSPGDGQVLWADLDVERSVRAAYAFSPAFRVTLAPQTPPQIALYCTNTGSASVLAVDRHARLVSGVIPVGAAPRGVAVDRLASRVYVALSNEDRIELIDAAASRSMGRVRLAPGDGPTELALAADGTLVVVNARSRTVSFVDPTAMSEVGRVPVGDAPVALRLDRAGRRAYVANRGSATVTVIDVPNRAVAGTIPTDPEPLWVDVSRDGTELYVVHRGSQYLGVFSLPSLAQRTRAFVGPGVTGVEVDPRTELIYLSRRDERRITVYDPVAFQLVDRFDVPGPVSRMRIDDAENTLLALVAERRALAVVDLTSRKVLSEIPVGPLAYTFAFAGERL